MQKIIVITSFMLFGILSILSVAYCKEISWFDGKKEVHYFVDESNVLISDKNASHVVVNKNSKAVRNMSKENISQILLTDKNAGEQRGFAGGLIVKFSTAVGSTEAYQLATSFNLTFLKRITSKIILIDSPKDMQSIEIIRQIIAKRDNLLQQNKANSVEQEVSTKNNLTEEIIKKIESVEPNWWKPIGIKRLPKKNFSK